MPGHQTLTVAHVVPRDLVRGAQRQLALFRRAAGEDGHRHHAIALFDAPEGLLGDAEHLRVPDGRLRRAGFDPRAAHRLRPHLASLGADVVVAIGGESLKYVVASRPSAPVVYHRIGVGGATAKRPTRVLLYRWLIARTDLVVAVSADVAADLEDTFHIADDRIVVVPNGRDPDVFAPAQPRRTDDMTRLLFVGHLTRTKRPEVFLRVVDELVSRGLPVRGTMVGDGPMLDVVRRDAGAAVEVLGARDDIPTLLQQADVFVFPSLPEGEGMPGVLVEAAMAGLPIVSTRVPGATDVVAHDVSGYVVAPDAIDDLVEHTARLAADAGLRARMGAAGRRRALGTLTQASAVAGWNAVLARVARPQVRASMAGP